MADRFCLSMVCQRWFVSEMRFQYGSWSDRFCLWWVCSYQRWIASEETSVQVTFVVGGSKMPKMVCFLNAASVQQLVGSPLVTDLHQRWSCF